ncbi:MAG: hypothetical protein K1X44_07850 [Alphaproteobacteria bacterium]|nr:hypothetical protein [Alphaproteobacteria bacterium]
MTQTLKTSDESKKELNHLCSELQDLLHKYERYLDQADVRDDVHSLKIWMQACQKGDKEIENIMDESTVRDLLEKVKTRLKLASNDLQRMDEESPVARHFTGGDTHKLNEAAKVIIETEEHLDNILNDGSTKN